jgi:hypothetical protein
MTKMAMRLDLLPPTDLMIRSFDFRVIRIPCSVFELDLEIL